MGERYNLLRISEGQVNAGKYGVYAINKIFNPKTEYHNWLIFIVSTPEGGERRLIAWYEEAELLKDWEERTDVTLTSSGNDRYPSYQILAPKAYSFLDREARPRVATLEKLPGKAKGLSMHSVYLSENGEYRHTYSEEVIEELLGLREKALKDGSALPPNELDLTENYFKSEGVANNRQATTLEGKRRWVRHLTRERSSKLRNEFLVNFKEKNDSLFCENCKFPENADFQNGEGILEVHHKKRLSSENHTGKTELEDLALLCPNCHRATHRGLIKGFIIE